MTLDLTKPVQTDRGEPAPAVPTLEQALRVPEVAAMVKSLCEIMYGVDEAGCEKWWPHRIARARSALAAIEAATKETKE